MMTVGGLKAIIEDLDDDAEVFVSFGNGDSARRISNVSVSMDHSQDKETGLISTEIEVTIE